MTTITNAVTVAQVTAANLNATVTGTVTANQGTAAAASNRWPVTVSDGSNSMPTMDVASRRGYQQITDGSNSAAVIATVNSLKSDLSSVAGTATVTAGVNGLVAIGGNAADAATDSGNPVKMGVIGRTTNRTSVTDGQRVNLIADKQGRLLCCPFGVRELISHQQTTITNSTSETTFVTQVASTFCDLLHLVVTNRSGTACYVTIKDATTGTTRMILNIAANGGAVLNFPAPMNQAVVNTNWTATLSVNTVTVDIFAMFVKNV